MKPYPRKGGGFYKDDGLPAQIPEDIDQIPNATPRLEPLRNAANKPYTVLGMSFTPMTVLQPFQQQGIGSWYGTKFNGLKTSNGDTYDMFAMTAAHPTLPLPCYVRVTNTQNNRSVIVRVNDRGPFHNGRIIDLSFTAAYKLGYVDQGSSPVRVELIIPDAGGISYADLSKDALAANEAKQDDKARYGEEVPKPGTSNAPYRVFNIGNHDPVELMSFVGAIEDALGMTAEKNFLPLQDGDVPATYADTAALNAWTGFAPATSVRDGVGRFVAWYRDYYKV